MISCDQTLDSGLTRACQRAADFIELTKPRVVLMVLVTTLVGFYLGSRGAIDYPLLVHTLVGTALSAAGTLALNQFVERETDALMERTRNRPLPAGKIGPTEALAFSAAVTAGGLIYLLLTAGFLSSVITLAIVVSYLFAYTPLKRKTSLCSIVGAVPGSLPPVIGWVAASSTLGTDAWVLFAILFFWQIPHSLAIAKVYQADYARAGIRLLPVIDPDGLSTERQIVTHSLALLAVGLLPTILGLTGWVYFIAALILGILFLGYGIALVFERSKASARKLLFASLVYLPVLLLMMAVDKVRV